MSNVCTVISTPPLLPPFPPAPPPPPSFTVSQVTGCRRERNTWEKRNLDEDGSKDALMLVSLQSIPQTIHFKSLAAVSFQR